MGTATYLQVSDTQQKLANAELSFEQAQFDLIGKMGNYFIAFSYPMDPLVRALDKVSFQKSQIPEPKKDNKASKKSQRKSS